MKGSWSPPKVIEASADFTYAYTSLTFVENRALLTYYVASAWERFRDVRWRIALQSAITSVTVGLVIASGYVLTRTIDHHWKAYAVTLITLGLALTTRLHPLWFLSIAAVLGALSVV